MTVTSWRLTSAIKNIYTPAGMIVTKQIQRDNENVKYEGYTFKLDNKSITFRIGQITQKRLGNFVAVYDRIDKTIVPIDINSREMDFLVVDVFDQKEQNRGQFVFPKAILLNKGIISNGLSKKERLQRKRGKLSFRVFPPWAQPSPTALKTQEWQRKFFFIIPKSSNPDFELLRRLFNKT